MLKALLPETGTDIKGQMRSEAELLEASGYAGHPRDFDDLVRILDREIRLITPTEAEVVEGGGWGGVRGGVSVEGGESREGREWGVEGHQADEGGDAEVVERGGVAGGGSRGRGGGWRVAGGGRERC